MKTKEKCLIIENNEISENIFRMKIETKEISKNLKAGQFLNIYTNSPDMILPRPISVHKIENEFIYIAYQVVGKGTKLFSTWEKGDFVDILGPLGNGFNLTKDKKVALIGGGIGAAPILELAKNLDCEKFVYLGFRDKQFLVDDFKEFSEKVYTISEVSNNSINGNVIDLLNMNEHKFDKIYACGPNPMLRALSAYAEDKKTDLEISLEERMACGFGVCVSCRVKCLENDKVVLKRICIDGPIFNSKEVIWQ